MKLHNVLITSKLLEKAITSIDSPKASGPDFVPVVVLNYSDLNFHTY